MKKVDLHIHSYYSDGSDSLDSILEKIEEEKIELFSITDHNFIAPELENLAKKAKNKNIQFLYGVEISCVDRKTNQSIHMLGYSKDFNIKIINKKLKPIIEGYNKRAKKIIKKLNKKFNLNLDFEKIISTNKNVFVSRNILAKMLIKKTGNKLTMKEALKESFVEEDNSWMPDIKDVISLIKNNGGKAFLAHPGNLINKLDFNDLLRRLKKAGLEGVEVYYRKHNFEIINFLKQKSKEFDLIMSGGSDWHGRQYSDFSPSVYINNDVYIKLNKL